jgi:hypothetical protein
MAGRDVAYRERMNTPWWWYPSALAVASLLAGEFGLSGHHLTVWIPFSIMLPLSVVVIWSLGRSRLEVSDGELRIQGAHVPVRLISGAVALDPGTLRRVLGSEGDPLAFRSVRPWIRTAVQFWLDDPDDPTPYWVVSTRRPDLLLDVIRPG